MAAELTRIFSDLHYGDAASRVQSLAQLRPLLDGVSHLVLNGDTFDTRPGLAPAHTATCRAEVLAFFPANVPRVTFLTGNHDSNLTANHALDLADGAVFVTHGDILHEDVVPWGQDAPSIRAQITAGLAALPVDERSQLAPRLVVWRSVTAAVPQRHQADSLSFRYVVHFANDTIWPPSRVWRVLKTWREEPARAAAFAREHRPKAKFIVVGHTHRPGAWRTPTGVVVINTGSFCQPFGGCVADLAGDRVIVRRMAKRGGEFRLGGILAEFSLADAGTSPRLSP